MKKPIILSVITLLSFLSLDAQNIGDYNKLAAENIPGLKGKFKSFEAAMQRVTQLGSLPDPNLSFGYFISPVETRVGPQRARISLSQMFPWFGTLKYQEEAATYLAEAKYQEYLDARNKLFYQVSAAYFPLYEVQNLMTIEVENIRILSSYKDIATMKLGVGKASLVDVLRVDLLLQDAATNLSILEAKKVPMTTQFNLLLNRDKDEQVIIEDTLNLTILSKEYRKDSLITSNPLLDEIDLKLKASATQEKLVVKQGFPKIGVGLDYVVVDKRKDVTMTGNGKDALMPMVSLSLPISREKYKAAQKETQIMQEVFALQMEETVNRLKSSYDLVWFTLEKHRSLIELYDRQIGTSQQTLDLLLTAYSSSGKDFEEVLRLQQQILKYKKMRLSSLTEYHIAFAELNYITGKSN